MEAEKFHNQLSPSWSTKKPHSIIQDKFKALRTRKTDSKSHLESKSLRTRSANVQNRRKGMSKFTKEQICPFFNFLFYSDPQWIQWCPPHWWGWSSLSLSIQILTSSRGNFINISRNNILPALGAYLSPVKLTYKINDHSGQMYFFIL